ncbi:MAG: aromatic amino acid transport family protein [Actinomycetota bacterium]
MTEGPGVVSRQELLGGVAGRRSSAALFAIESRASFLAQRARHTAIPAVCEEMVEARERTFMSALAAGRDLPREPRAQDLERYAPSLAHLVPSDPAGRAGLASLISTKYPARSTDVPQLRQALGLSDSAVRRQLRIRQGCSPDELWATRLPWRERARWWRSRLAGRLEDLSPFWSAFSLTLTQTVGAGILALPIALAGVGPLPGLVVVVLIGLVNVLTVAAIAESFTRAGTVRWGGAYLGRVVRHYLGRAAQAVLSVALLSIAVVALLAYYVGFASVLAAATAVPPLVWVGLLFAVTLGFVWRGRLDATVASALVVGAVNIAILLVLSGLALGDLDPGNLTYAAVPFTGGQAFDSSVVALVFGVVLLAFFGHTSVANGARAVLRRDPGGRSLVGGSAAGMATAVLLYGVWTVAVGGAVAPSRLAGETGTALEPLAEATGTAVLVVGSVFVVLAMGMAAVHFSLGLHFQAAELVRGNGRAARAAAFAPLVAVFAVAEVLFATGRESFSGSLGAIGTLAAPLIAGIVPVLLLASSRRRGDYVPALRVLSMRHPVTAGAVYVLFLLALVAHATVIWTAPVGRISAALVAVVAVAVTVRVLRSDAMRPLAVVELRRDAEVGRARLRVLAGGARAECAVTVSVEGAGDRELVVAGALELPPRTTAVTLDLRCVTADQIRVWAHEVDATGASWPLDVTPRLHTADGAVELRLANGAAVAPLPASATLTLDLSGHAGRPRPPAEGRDG